MKVNKYTERIFILLVLLAGNLISCSDSSEVAPLISNGQGGSLARFAIKDNIIYVVNNNSLQTIKLINGKMEPVASMELPFGIETIFPYQEYLFIGANDAMYIYSLDDPEQPGLLATYQHQTACDPVVVQNNVAYVSLRADACGRVLAENIVEIIDVSDINNPRLIYTHNDVLSPYGLGIKDDVLFICQSKNGLQLLDVKDPNQPVVISNLDIYAYDVIIRQNLLILTGDEGIFQFDVSDPKIPEQMSHIAIDE
jgi:hypothetical protein